MEYAWSVKLITHSAIAVTSEVQVRVLLWLHGTFKKFIAVRINAEKREGVDFANLKDVHGYPTILFFDENGTEVDRVVGYQPADAFLSSLRIARRGGIQGLVKAAAEHPSDPALLFTLADKYAQKGDTLHAFPYFRGVVQYDVHDSLHRAEQAAHIK